MAPADSDHTVNPSDNRGVQRRRRLGFYIDIMPNMSINLMGYLRRNIHLVKSTFIQKYMIQLNELRLGNYIKSDDGIICSLERIESKDFTDWNSGDDYSLTAKEVGTKDNYLNCINDSFKPIPLTEEILLKCGFEKDGNFYYIKSFKSIYLSRPWLEANHLLLKTLGGECISKIKHLHQLQNLYFAIAGKELEINL